MSRVLFCSLQAERLVSGALKLNRSARFISQERSSTWARSIYSCRLNAARAPAD